MTRDEREALAARLEGHAGQLSRESERADLRHAAQELRALDKEIARLESELDLLRRTVNTPGDLPAASSSSHSSS